MTLTTTHYSSNESFIVIILPTAALVTMEVPPVVRESDLDFTASVFLVKPEVSTASLEINLMDTEITALNPGKLAAPLNFSLITTPISPTEDYSRSQLQAVILTGTTRWVNRLYNVEDDNIAEPNETLTISISKASASTDLNVSFNISSANVTIIDDDSEELIHINKYIITSIY